MQEVQVLPTLLIPFLGGQAILPSNTVVETLPFATSLKLENAPPWVVGAILWQARTTPLISLEYLLDGEDPGLHGHSRIIMVHALGNNPKLPHFGFLGTGVPRPLELKREAIELDGPVGLAPDGVLRRVLIDDEPVVIPDMDTIEAALAGLVRA